MINKESITKFFRSGSKRSIVLKRNIAGSLLAKGISIIISLMIVPMTLGYVTPEIYGIWLTLSSIIHWLTFFDIGFTQGLKNKLAEALALGDYEKGKALVSTTYIMMFSIFIPLAIILCLFVPLLNWTSILNVDRGYEMEISNTLYILIWAFCFHMVVGVLSTVIVAHQKMALSSIILVIGNFFSLIAVYILTLCKESSLFLLACSLSFIPIFVLLFVGFFLYKGTFRLVKPSLRSFDKHYIKEIWGLGYRFFLIQVQYIVLFQATNFIIANLSGPEDVTTYNIAYKYLNVAMMVFSITLSSLWPAFTDAHAKNDFEWMRRIYRKMSKVFFIVSLFVILMVLISPIVYMIWIGEKVSMPISMTIVVALYMIINMWDSLQVNVINGIGKLKIQMYVTMAGLILHIPLSYIFGYYIGCYGVLLSMIIIITIYSIAMTKQVRRLLNRTATGIWAE